MTTIATYTEFERLVVQRDFDDFMASKGDLRKAWHCAVSLFHLHDWLYVAHRSSINRNYKFRDTNRILKRVSCASHFANSLAQKHPNFQLIRKIANSEKHLELDRVPPGPTMPRDADDTFIVEDFFDPSIFDPKTFQTGEVMLKGSPDRKFADLARSVRRMWDRLFVLEGW